MPNRIEHIAPLHHPPRRIRPPFNVDSCSAETSQRHADQVAALLEPLDGVELGAHDRRIIGWLADWDIETVGTIASLLYRARAIDAAGGAQCASKPCCGRWRRHPSPATAAMPPA